MIGLDTNVLVRFIAQDDPVQCQLTDETMRSVSVGKPAWIGIAVILELAWVMIRIYKIGRPAMIRLLDDLLGRQEFVIEQNDIVHEALRLYRKGKTEFADCLIAASARAAGCSATLTFDSKAVRDAGMKLIE